MKLKLIPAIILCALQYPIDGRAQDTTRLSLLFLGDIMQHDSQIKAAYNDATTGHTYDYSDCFRFVKPYIQSVDVAIGNLELTLAGPPFKGYPQFSAPDELAITLKDIGMDVLVTANNHSVDRGKKGIDRTIEMLDSLKIIHTGTFKDTVDRMNDYPLFIQKNGFTFALLNYTYGTNGIAVTKPNVVNLIDTAVMRRDIITAKTGNPDFIIVFTHWGKEYESQPSSIQKKITELCFKWGVQLVIGSHPHVLQPMEWRKPNNQLVTYSLGNFVSGQRDRYKDGGAMVQVEFLKVTSDSVSTTMIDSAGYILEWVYRTADDKKDYYVLPVTKFENDTTGFIKDEASRLALKTFAGDSRKLLGKYNVNIPEIRKRANDEPSVEPSDSMQIKNKIERFYSWYATLIKNKTVNTDFNPQFVKRSDGMTTLDFTNYRRGLKQNGFTDSCINSRIRKYNQCVENLSRVKYDKFLKFKDLDQYEEIKCDFGNVFEWFAGMEPFDRAELVGLSIMNERTILGDVKFINGNGRQAKVRFLKQGGEWRIDEIKFD